MFTSTGSSYKLQTEYSFPVLNPFQGRELVVLARRDAGQVRRFLFSDFDHGPRDAARPPRQGWNLRHLCDAEQ